jgi:DNA-binding NarL/FixJ family response regulator
VTSPTGGPTVMLVDPHPLWMDAVDGLLRRVGARVVDRATTGLEALGRLTTTRPDALVTEIAMPRGDVAGLELLRRAQEMLPGLRSIVLTTSDHPAQVDGAMAAGACAYVLKSAALPEMTAAVREALGRSVPGALTSRERQLLRLAAAGHSDADIARMLWVTADSVRGAFATAQRKLHVAEPDARGRLVRVSAPAGDAALRIAG